ncbi:MULTISPECIES: proline dehydrogenase family protein [Staphylococcus]|uniref:proline dehydrogenase family protein n=1 Tax=Staphylococcus TaxID=1279 RepID=UPI000D9B4EA0|nr:MULTISPECIES: proline dehydrogenase [Staphylococcus]MBY6181439.1 proline dehydrogenase [Staphylococcaceae bacterium DP2N0-1]MCH4383078.1 proline dehydrogenase [Staphylococcus haemolyticus]MCH4389376.1 proline dehydrogenase [Staphylococcus haemolyticus]MCH4403771.1 proline dehydrogenase [Staphylococcus haemolyticus]MCH4519093.1 proline dehydrogenase [Staphylococcus haemolyticus]
MSLFKNFFIALSNSTYLNETAKKVGPKMGANKVVAGNTIEQLIDTIERLNDKNIAVTVDNLGEFVGTVEEATQAKNEILEVMQAIKDYNVDAHMSVKLSSLGGEFDTELAYNNLREILLKANEFDNMHINIDTEKFDSLQQIVEVLDRLKGEFRNVGTVIQAYLYDAIDLIEKYPNLRLRLVKGAYKEAEQIAYQTKEEIDANYIKIIEKRLLNAKNYTSIATHDDQIINHVKQFVKSHNIDRDQFEFQMLYGFRSELAEDISRQGYHFTIYVPYGNDWFGYFMRRLAERPQNLALAYQEFVSTKTLKKIGLFTSLGLGVAFIISGFTRLLKR